jgi:dihydrofolate synthase/folylpolyglutamate synthase
MYDRDASHPCSSLAHKLAAIYTLNTGRRIESGFRPSYLSLLQKMGNPERRLPPIIHVAGTNGKGSVIAFLQSILQASGYNVHVYTSPHLQVFNERIQLNGQMIDDQTLERAIDYILDINQNAPLTFFEFATALAFWVFSQHPADFVLLEVGMGGRLDCTNIIPDSLCSVITALSFDHTEYLGTTIEQIAFEKAGIMRPNHPCFTIHQPISGALDCLKTRAMTIKADLNICPPAPIDLNLSLKGAHQYHNAGLSVGVAHFLQECGYRQIQQSTIHKGLESAHWPARLQKISFNPFFPERDDLEYWVDGGHNDSAAAALAQQMQQWDAEDTPRRPLYVMFGMLQGKDISGFITPMLPYITTIIPLEIPHEPKAYSNEDLFMLCQEQGWPVQRMTDFKPAENARILITGSLYLAGHILSSSPLDL